MRLPFAKDVEFAPDNASLSKRSKAKLTQKIKLAMQHGQTTIRICRLGEKAGDFITYPDFEVPGCYYQFNRIRDVYTKQHLGDQHVAYIHTKYRTLASWLREQGLGYVVLGNTIDMGFGRPAVLGSVLFFAAIIMPDFGPRMATLKALWNGFYTQRCADLSLLDQWKDRIRACIQLGQMHCVLVTLTSSCFEWKCDDAGENDFMRAYDPRDVLTMRTVQPQEEGDWYVQIEPQFKPMIAWLTKEKWHWTCAFQDGRLEDCCYLVVFLHELLPSQYM